MAKKAEKPVKPPGRHKHRHTARKSMSRFPVRTSRGLRVNLHIHVENIKFFLKLVD